VAIVDQTHEDAFETRDRRVPVLPRVGVQQGRRRLRRCARAVPEDVHWWLSATTQVEECEKVVKAGTPSEEADRSALLDALVARLDTPMGSGGPALTFFAPTCVCPTSQVLDWTQIREDGWPSRRAAKSAALSSGLLSPRGRRPGVGPVLAGSAGRGRRRADVVKYWTGYCAGPGWSPARPRRCSRTWRIARYGRS